METPQLPKIVHVIGASGRSGQAVCRALIDAGVSFVPVVRNAAKWAASGIPVAPALADLSNAAALKVALQGAIAVVSCAHARHAAVILQAAPPGTQFVLLGSTRKFTRWPDAHGNGVLAGEAAFLTSGRAGVMLHPTMIYGAQGEDNVRRLAAMLRRLWLLPLPRGGSALVQPIHQDDVTRCILAALARTWNGPHSLIVAGPAAVTYADFVRAVAKAAGLPPPRIVNVPAWPLRAMSFFTRLPGLPTIGAAEIRRLMEDKAFNIDPMRETLRVHPQSLQQGLTSTFPRPTPKSQG